MVYCFKKLLKFIFRECYVTNDAINNKRSEILRVLNWSFRQGCLQCSFSDKNLNDYIQFKRRNSRDQEKSGSTHWETKRWNVDSGSWNVHLQERITNS